MFYAMIKAKRDEWLLSDSCTIKSLIYYIEKNGQMRDAQIDAIKTYLFLKIVCNSRPLAELFCHGTFNTLSLDDVELSSKTREYLAIHPGAAALFEYSRLKNDKGEQVSLKLEKQIRQDPESIDYRKFFKDVFYKLTYTDYLFSLPMGAGKTFLMAAFIYLDLYFASNEPNNPAFAHNFIIFAPSGLKSSVVPSLKTIQNFNPAWILPEPAATTIQRLISFEVLDQGQTANKSNKTRNPNAQKIANHQPFSDLFGLVVVCNAEKVILDRIQEKAGQISFFDKSLDAKDRQANELRNLLGKLPALSVFIDEVHHAVSDDIKLRAVVTRWAENHTINSVIGFSGTPYLEKAEKFAVTDTLSVATAEITNIVYYYPLIDGIGNFLKQPVVKIAEIADSSHIIENGVREFLNAYRDTVYGDGTVAKLGIYCGTIEKLEELVYPLVARIAAEYGLGSDAILKFHKGDSKKKYSQPADMGALTYRPSWDVSAEAALSDLDELAGRCQAILNREDVSNLDDIFRMGGSSGGARPKVMTDEWVIKFPASGDMKDTGLMEKEYMDCAEDCGITVPETKLLPSKLCSGYFSVRRFDREGSVRRHMLTAAAILETDWRTAALDYHTLMKLTHILSYGNEADMLQMYRRMCFNVFAHNRDDHAKNFSWIYDAHKDCWHPSPAYDLTWSTTHFGEHTTTVDGNGRNPGMNELVAVGKAAGIPVKKCKAVAEEIREKTELLEKKYRDARS